MPGPRARGPGLRVRGALERRGDELVEAGRRRRPLVAHAVRRIRRRSPAGRGGPTNEEEWHGGHPEPARRRRREPADPRVEGHPEGRPHAPGPRLRRPGVRRRPTAARRCCATSQSLYDHGRLGGTGYVSILPVDQGIEHSAAASFAPNPEYFDPANIVELAIEGGCNAVATTFGVLGAVVAAYAHKIPFIVKLNHNELLTYPNKFDQIMFGTVAAGLRPGRGRRRRHDLLRLRRVAPASCRRCSEAFAEAHELGMFTVLWCYLRNSALQDGRRRLPRRRRPHRPGQPPRRHDRGRHHQAEAAREQRRLQRARRYGKTSQAGLRRAHHRPPDRPHPLAGGELLHGPHRADQQRRRVQGRGRPGRRPCAPR